MRLAAAVLLLALSASGTRAAEPVVAEEAEVERFRFVGRRILAGATIEVPHDWKVAHLTFDKCGRADCTGRLGADLYLRSPWFWAEPGARWAHIRIRRVPMRGRAEDERPCTIASIKSLTDYAEEIDCTVACPECPSRYTVRSKGPRDPTGGLCGYPVEDDFDLPMGKGRAFLLHTVSGSFLAPLQIPRMRKMVQYELIYKVRGDDALYSFEISTNRTDRDWFAPAFARAVTSFRIPGRAHEPMDPKIVEQLETGWEMDSETLMNEHIEAVKARRGAP